MCVSLKQEFQPKICRSNKRSIEKRHKEIIENQERIVYSNAQQNNNTYERGQRSNNLVIFSR